MAQFKVYEKPNNTNLLQELGPPIDDWVTVRDWLKTRGRSAGSQVVIVLDGQIYAIERTNGNGFAMADQSRQSDEDLYWYHKH